MGLDATYYICMGLDLELFAQVCTTRSNTLQHTATTPVIHRATHCNTATHCITLQHTATHCNTLQHAATHCNNTCDTSSNALQHTATHRNTLQHTATHCNTLQHAATRCNTPQQHLRYIEQRAQLEVSCRCLQHVFLPLQHTKIHHNKQERNTATLQHYYSLQLSAAHCNNTCNASSDACNLELVAEVSATCFSRPRLAASSSRPFLNMSAILSSAALIAC